MADSDDDGSGGGIPVVERWRIDKGGVGAAAAVGDDNDALHEIPMSSASGAFRARTVVVAAADADAITPLWFAILLLSSACVAIATLFGVMLSLSSECRVYYGVSAQPARLVRHAGNEAVECPRQLLQASVVGVSGTALSLLLACTVLLSRQFRAPLWRGTRALLADVRRVLSALAYELVYRVPYFPYARRQLMDKQS
jgi:hypothetical protein